MFEKKILICRGQVNFYDDLLRFSWFIIPFNIDRIMVSLYYKCVPKVCLEIIKLNYFIVKIIKQLRRNFVRKL